MLDNNGVLGHGGQTLGFQSDGGYIPDKDVTIVMWSNAAESNVSRALVPAIATVVSGAGHWQAGQAAQAEPPRYEPLEECFAQPPEGLNVDLDMDCGYVVVPEFAQRCERSRGEAGLHAPQLRQRRRQLAPVHAGRRPGPDRGQPPVLQPVPA